MGSGQVGASLFGPAAPDLDLLESRLRESFAQDGRAAEPMAQLLAAGGKRLRPALVFLAARLGSFQLEPAMRAAMAVELVHAATLVHDDVIDGSDVRRGRPTVVAESGPAVAIVVADFYSVRAYMEASRTGRADAVAILAQAIMEVCEGELLQQSLLDRYRIDLADYQRMIAHKTAALLSASCELGALVGGLSEAWRGQLAAFGRELGIAFQIVDDVLDYSAEAEVLGKPAGHDLIEGNATLPLLLALDELGEDSHLARMLVEGRRCDADQAARVVTSVRETAAIERARAEALAACERAGRAIEGLPDCPELEALRTVARYVIERSL